MQMNCSGIQDIQRAHVKPYQPSIWQTSEKIDLTSDKPTIRPKAVKSRSVEVVLLFVDFNKAIYLEKMGDILLPYSLRTFKTTILYKNTRSLIRSPECDTEFFNIVAEELLIYQIPKLYFKSGNWFWTCPWAYTKQTLSQIA